MCVFVLGSVVCVFVLRSVVCVCVPRDNTENDPGTLVVCQSPYPNAVPCPLRVPAIAFSLTHWVPLPACRPHVPRYRCPVPCSQTNMDRARLERNCGLSTCLTSVAASASEMFAGRAWLCAPFTPRDCRPAKVLVSTLPADARTAVLLHGLQR